MSNQTQAAGETPVRIGIVGTGFRPEVSHALLSVMDGAELVALASSRVETRKPPRRGIRYPARGCVNSSKTPTWKPSGSPCLARCSKR